MPAVALGKSIAPFEGVKRFLEGTVFVFPTHQFGLFVKEVLVVLTSFGKKVNLFVGVFFRAFCQLQDGPVVICIFQGTAATFVDFYIIGNVSQTVVIINSFFANRCQGPSCSLFLVPPHKAC